MNILITQKSTYDNKLGNIDLLEDNYIKYFEGFGLKIFPLPNRTKYLDSIIEITKPDGIVLSGGGDISPELYGGIVEDCRRISRERDETERLLLDIAIKKDIPVFGICRGMQFINIYFGGKLVSDISKIDIEGFHQNKCTHEINIIDKSILNIVHPNSDYITNSFHHQGVRSCDLGKNLKVFANYKRLDLIEGIYHQEYPIAGVQWHPERPNSALVLDKILMNAFKNRKLFWENRK